MSIERFDVDHQRYLGHPDPNGDLCYYKDVAELEAINARLLDALKEIVDQTDGSDFSHIQQDRAHTIARAAIANAEGEQP